MKNYYRLYFRELPAILLVLLVFNSATAQTKVSFESEQWEIDSQSHLLLEYQGKQALYLLNGEAILKGVSLKNVIIEFDIAFSGERGFTGVIWRRIDPGNFEDFYLRPHQSGNPDANQYTPVFNGVSGWQLYHGEGYGSPIVYPMNQWIHVKVVSREDHAQIFIDDMDEPAVQVPDLKHQTRSGEMGLRAFLTPTYFSDFSHRQIETAPFDPIAPVESGLQDGMIKSWEVSTPFEESRLESLANVDEGQFSNLKWQNLKSEVTGITNLARLNGIQNDKNTVFVRLVLDSNQQQIKKFQFGYSDKVRVYVNGDPVYGGNNTYTSRDYRYLGTIGLFDEIYLPIQEGENEILFAVTEAFGGWGIIGRFENSSGIEVK